MIDLQYPAHWDDVLRQKDEGKLAAIVICKINEYVSNGMDLNDALDSVTLQIKSGINTIVGSGEYLLNYTREL